jgi:hypothetical protein
VRFLLQQRPAVSYPANAASFHTQESTRGNCTEWDLSTGFFDGRFVAHHRSTVGLVLPYDDSMDYMNWYVSQHTADMATGLFFGAGVAYFGMVGKVDMLAGNIHSNYPRGNREKTSEITRAHLLEAFKKGAGGATDAVAAAHLDDVNWYSKLPEKCFEVNGADFKPWRAPKAMPTAAWLTGNMNTDHIYVKQRLRFMSLHPAWFPANSPFERTTTVCGVPSV